jgi:hypothetical protein
LNLSVRKEQWKHFAKNNRRTARRALTVNQSRGLNVLYDYKFTTACLTKLVNVKLSFIIVEDMPTAPLLLRLAGGAIDVQPRLY